MDRYGVYIATVTFCGVHLSVSSCNVGLHLASLVHEYVATGDTLVMV